MDTVKVNFAKRLGNKILHEEKQLILYSVTQGNYILALNGDSTPKPYLIDECKIIATKDEIESQVIPLELAVIPAAGRFISAIQIFSETLQEKEDEIVLELCRCAGITYNQFMTNKTRKRDYVQARQIHTAVIKLFTAPKGATLTDIGDVHDYDHSSVLHCVKVVKNVADDFIMRKKFESAFRLIAIKFPDTAHKHINLDWL